MNLYTFAHRGEALVFLEQHQVRPIDFFFDGLFEFVEGPLQSHYLLILGEGPYLALTKLTALLATNEHILKNKITKVINLGVAGSLRPEIKKNQIYSIRTAYFSSLEKLEFSSFTLENEKSNIDCITATERITDPQKAMKLGPIASIVDRELWGLARAAQMFQIPLSSYKLISDEAHLQANFCQTTIENAFNFSKDLWDFSLNRNFFLANDKKINIKSSAFDFLTLLNQDFYLTHSQKYLLKNLIDIFKSRHLSIEQIFPPIIENLKEEVLSPKQRTQKLISILQEKSNPHVFDTKLKLESLLLPLKKLGHQPSFDPLLERSELKLSVTLRNETDALLLAKELKNFSFTEMNNILDGKI